MRAVRVKELMLQIHGIDRQTHVSCTDMCFHKLCRRPRCGAVPAAALVLQIHAVYN